MQWERKENQEFSRLKRCLLIDSNETDQPKQEVVSEEDTTDDFFLYACKYMPSLDDMGEDRAGQNLQGEKMRSFNRRWKYG